MSTWAKEWRLLCMLPLGGTQQTKWRHCSTLAPTLTSGMPTTSALFSWPHMVDTRKLCSSRLKVLTVAVLFLVVVLGSDFFSFFFLFFNPLQGLQGVSTSCVGSTSGIRLVEPGLSLFPNFPSPHSSLTTCSTCGEMADGGHCHHHFF